jgi:hypothetical protein
VEGTSNFHGHAHGTGIVLFDPPGIPFGGFIANGPDGLQVGIYGHVGFKEIGTTGGGFYWDVNKLGNYFNPDYWLGRL